MTDNLTIRRMTPEDLSSVVLLEKRCYPNPWSEAQFRRELNNPLALIELVFLGERFAGYLCSWQVADEMHILNVATAPEFRRRGIAGELLARCLERAAVKGGGRLLLEVREGNARALSLYRAFGFKVTGERSRYYPDGENALLMERVVEGEGKR